MGGCIRDSLLGITPKDIDIAVPCDPIPIANRLAKDLGGTCVIIGTDHRIGRIIKPCGRNDWVIDVARLDGTVGNDLASRDFTIDSMALSILDWTKDGWENLIIDPFCGKTDTRNGIVRAINPKVFHSDPARLLRAVRLSASLGFSIDTHTYNLILENAGLLNRIAAERTRDELLRIISLEGAKTHLQTLDGLGLLCRIMPELGLTKGVGQPKEHHWDVFTHSIEAVGAVERVVSSMAGGNPVSQLLPLGNNLARRFREDISDGHTRLTFLKLGALLHDIAKPQTKAITKDGRTRFLNHQILGAKMSRDILKRLRLGNRGRENVCALVQNHLRPGQMSHNREYPTRRAIYRFFKDIGDTAVDVLYLNLADHLAARGPDLDQTAWEWHSAMVGHVLTFGLNDGGLANVPKLVNGDDLIKECGLEPGPIVGHLLEQIREATVTGELSTKRAALNFARSNLNWNKE